MPNKNSLIDKTRSKLNLPLISLIGFGIIAVLITWSGLKVARTNYDLQREIAQLEQENELTQLENDNLRLRNQYYESDQYLELAAREKFNKAESGEKLYLVPDEVAVSHTVDRPESDGSDKPEQDKSERHQNFDAWMEFLFRRE